MRSRRHHVIVIGNVKGGVGKTTTAVQLALHAGATGQQVLLIDADPGRSALSWASRALDDWPPNVAAIAHPHVDLPRRLPALVSGFDLVIIDTPHSPTEGTDVGPLLRSAVAVADLLIVPTALTEVDLDRLPDMLGAIDDELNRRYFNWNILLTQVDLRARGPAEATAARMRTGRGLPVLDSVVPQRAAVARAFGSAERIVEYDAVARDILAIVAAIGAVGEEVTW